MTKFSLFLLSFLGFLGFGNRLLALDTGVNYIVFATPEQTYLEINLAIAGKTVTFKKVDSTHLQAAVEVMILIKNGDEIVNFEKYILNSPLVVKPQMLVDVKRLMVPNGKYTLEVDFTDVGNPVNRDQYRANFDVALEDRLYLSDIQLLNAFYPDSGNGPFNKNGYYLEPLPFGYYERQAVKLAFYAEIYHSTTLKTKYNVRYFIEKLEGNGLKSLISAGSQQKTPSDIDAVLVQMDISKVESGNYALTVELRSETNEVLLTRTVPFQRVNPFFNFDPANLTSEMLENQFVQQLQIEDLEYVMRAIGITVASTESEMLNDILKSKDEKAMRYFIFKHFVTLDHNNPEAAFNRYIDRANAVNARFQSGFRYGFESDRGRTFMRFGKPDDLVHVEDDPSAPPYEIWIYYNFPKTAQQNVKFLFYNPSLAGEDFILLHSNARGEIKNPKWERILYSRNAPDQEDGDNFNDATQVKGNVGRNARAYFEDF